MQIEVVESVTKTIGSLALAYPYLRRLGAADIIDALTTKGKERHVSTGQVIEILVLNRLSLRPTPISKIDAWAQTQAVEEVYSLAANALNDDRIGRALDEVPAQTMNGQPVAKITYGFTGKEDPTRKQLTISLSVAADGGIPAWYRLADGNAADTRVYLAHLTAVRERLQLDKPLVVGDSKLITRANMLGFCRVGARFIGPTSLKETDRLSLRRLWEAGESLHRLDEPADGQEPSVGRYWGLEQREVLPDPEQATQYALRRLFVQSLDDRKAARHQRAKDLVRARYALWTIKGRLERVLSLVVRSTAD